MKILVAHNLYRSSTVSGENAVYRAEVELLRDHGHTVITFERNNDDLDRASAMGLALLHGPQTLWSANAYRELRRTIRRERPDVAHFHNVFSQISPSAFWACKKEGVPVVVTVHNYRHGCADGILFREGKVCEECLDHTALRAIRHRCYRNSGLQSATVVASQLLHRALGTWRTKVDRFIALTEFSRQKLEQIGLPAQRIAVKPNFLVRPSDLEPENGDALVFIGRLDESKGIRVLLEATRHMPAAAIHVVGTGPLEDEVRQAAGANLVFHGHCEAHETLRILAGARALIMPSIWYETFGRTTMEAFALGKPVIASDLGCMRELVDHERTGMLFPAGDAAALAEQSRRLLDDAELALRLGRAARQEFDERFTPTRNYEMLRAIYDGVLHST